MNKVLCSLSKLSCFTDASRNTSRSGALDGVRAVAALLVAGGHFGVIYSNYSRLGVWVFFCLSGYLLALHGIRRNHFHIKELGEFFIRRFFRIYPLYLVAILLCSVFGSPNVDEKGIDYFVTRSTFIYAEGYFWSVKQEVVFYCLLPLLLLLCAKFSNRSILAGVFFLAACLSTTSGALDYLRVNVDAVSDRALFLGPFLMGVALAYFVNVASVKEHLIRSRYSGLLLWFSSIILVFVPFTYGAGSFFQSSAAMYSVVSSVPFIIMAIAVIDLNPSCLIAKFLSFYPLRAIGVVGYGFYMWHWPINLLLEKIYLFQGIAKLVVTGGIVYVFACFTYCVIEKPFITLSNRLVSRSYKASKVRENEFS